MSEYQYYEFLALDQPLSAREMGELRSISTRAEITPTHFSNDYSYGDLKADSAKLLERYFDVHVYVVNWGTRRLAMRLPREALVVKDAKRYCVGDGTRIRRVGEHILIDLWSETEDYDGWVEGSGWMASLAGARGELLRGDERVLYLAWLLAVESWEVEDDDLEPPVPPGLGSLPTSLSALAEFLRIDAHLIAAAAESSQAEELENAGLAEWIATLATQEKDAMLLRVAQGEQIQVATELARGFRAETRRDTPNAQQERRSVGEIRARAEELREAHDREEAKRTAENRKTREAHAAAAREKRLDALVSRQTEAWKNVQQLVDTTKQSLYDEAVVLLLDLRDLAARDGEEKRFEMLLATVQERNSRRYSFIDRLKSAGLARGS